MTTFTNANIVTKADIDELVALLHHSKLFAVSGRQLANQLDTNERFVRSIVREARLRGICIGSSASVRSSGYWLITNNDEIRENIAYLRSHATSLTEVADALEAAL